jgi:hypothetical protein
MDICPFWPGWPFNNIYPPSGQHASKTGGLVHVYVHIQYSRMCVYCVLPLNGALINQEYQ